MFKSQWPRDRLQMLGAKGTDDPTPEDPIDETLMVYLEILNRGPVSTEELQRSLGQQTRSDLAYHLGKLAGAGYVIKGANGEYSVSADAAKVVLTGYSKIGSAMIPQLGFFAVLFSILIGFFSLESSVNYTFVPFLIVTSSGSAAALWYMTYRLWRRTVPSTNGTAGVAGSGSSVPERSKPA